MKSLLTCTVNQEADVECAVVDEQDWLLRFDQFIKLSTPTKNKDGRKLPVNKFAEQACQILRKGWVKRFSTFTMFDTGASKNGFRILLVGVQLLPGWNNPVTRGPPANEAEAREFREFFGEKSEMRKYPDNSICEAVSWISNENAKPKFHENVLSIIAEVVLTRHFVKVRASVRTLDWRQRVSPLKLYEPLTSAFDKLGDALRNVKDLPLTVSSVTCTSPFYRRTESFPPLGRFIFEKSKSSTVLEDGVARPVLALSDEDGAGRPLVPFFTHGLNVMLTLEHSSKFGETLPIINKFKTAFYIEISQRLKKDHGMFAVATEKALYVAVDNIAFVVEIGQSKEIAAAKRHEKNKQTALIPDGCDWKSLEHRFEQVPHMSNLIHGLGQRFSAFPEAVQLFKRFIAAHCLLDHFDEMAVELIVASVFMQLDGTRGVPPPDPFSGFIQVIAFMATHDFSSKPLFVDFNGTLDEEAQAKMLEHFLNARPVLPALVIFTSEDSTGVRFTKSGPELVIFSRVVELCAGALLLIRKHMECAVYIDHLKLFTPSPFGFDIVIWLRKEAINFSQQNHELAIKHTADVKFVKKDLLPVINLNPIQSYLNELKQCFGTIALFSLDRYDGNFIGVHFRPSFNVELDSFKVGSSVCRKCDESTFGPNFKEFKETVKLLGLGIVQNVQFSKSLKSILKEDENC